MEAEGLERRLAEKAPALDATGRDLLTLLALAGATNISGLSKLAAAAGVRETATRQHSTTTLRPHIEALIRGGLALEVHEGFAIPRSAKPLLLRSAAASGRLSQLARVVMSERFESRYTYSGSPIEAQKALLELDVALAECSPTLQGALDRALATADALGALPEVEVALRSVFPALGPGFDAAWFERVPAAVQPRLFRLAVEFAETVGQPLAGLYPFALARPQLFVPDAASHAAFFGVAVLTGELDGACALVEFATADLRSTLAAALAAARGEFSQHHPFAPPKQHARIGVARLLQALLLLGRGRAEDLEAVGRIVHAGNRKTAPFRRSAGWLKDLLEHARSQREASLLRAFEHNNAADCLEPLMQGLCAIWCDSGALADLHAKDCWAFAESFDSQGMSWLSAQYSACAAKLETLSPVPSAQRRASQQAASEAAKRRAAEGRYALPGRALFELHSSKEAWEHSLEALERLAAAVPVGEVEPGPSLQERIVWRVTPSRLEIEPFLQTRKGAGYTRGRKLALKHLLQGAAQLERLPREDRAVAEHVREKREGGYGYGYPQIYQYFERRAWLALVGHPRVEHAATEVPVEVQRGAVQIAAHVKGGVLELELEPAGLTHEVEVREESGRLVVYAVEERALPLLKVLGAKLALPVAARERALEVLGRLSHLLPVQTSERTTAQQVSADPRTWLRILPRGAGLSVSAFVRPLGTSGPELTPASGSSRLLGHQGGNAVQTERDLQLEQKHLSDWLEQCPMLEGTGLESEPVLLEDATQCLELLSALQRPGCEVVVEWPEGTPLKLRGRVDRRALRAKIQRGAAHFFASGSLMVDDSLSLDLEELVALVVDSPGKFARLSNGDFIELERDLRETLELLGSVRRESSERGRVVLPSTALASLLPSSSEGDGGFELDSTVTEHFTRLESAFSSTPRLPRGLEAQLREYQVEGFRWLARLGDAELGGCLADDMGLGKTLQAIALLLQRAKQGPALVVAPTSVCDNWRRELARFAPTLEVRYFAGPERSQVLGKLGPRQVIIASYALLQQDVELFRPLNLATVVLDEAQMIKNPESLRAQAACALNAKVRFALTGTPVENHLGDLYSIFRFLLPDLVGSWPAFSRRFGVARDGEAGAQARRSLKRLLKPYLLRRTKGQVLEELPPLTEIEHRVTLGPTEAALYEGIRRKALQALEEGLEGRARDPKARFRVLAEITRLRRLCCHPQLVAPGAPDTSAKLDALLELLDELQQGRHRALVFSQFVDVLSLVRTRLDARGISYQYLDGSTPPARRSAAVDAFQSGEGDVFLISLKAGGFGLNLTAADYVIHVDPWWNPAVEAQASDRAHRIGQTRPVTVYRLIAESTIEERIVELHRHKRDLADSLLDESHTTAQLGAEELRALLVE